MSEFIPTEELRKHRPLLLTMEAIGWLHMTGKANVEFLKTSGASNFKKWHEKIDFDLEIILGWIENDVMPLLSHKGKDFKYKNQLITLLENFDDGKSKEDFCGLLQAAHAMASGIEKNLPKNTSRYLSQDTTHMWASTALGYPQKNLLHEFPWVLSEEGWGILLNKINALFIELETLGRNCSDADLWHSWREAAIGPKGFLRKAYLSTLAETRLPNNDVTLWDQSYVAASLFKSAVAGAILAIDEDRTFKWDNLKSQTRWRLLTVGIGADHYEERAVRIGDWTGFSREKDEFFKKVKKLIEVDLAIGNLLYADTDVQVYTFPGVKDGQKDEDFNSDFKAWEDCLIDVVNQYAQEYDFETPPYCKISENSSRSLIGMTKEINEARGILYVPIHKSWDISSRGNVHICPVCQVRFNKPEGVDLKPNYRKEYPCSICKKRRTHRLDQWLEGDPNTDSIWIDELADSNNRLALLTMSFDLDPWMDGTHIDSLRTQAAADWRKYNPFLAGKNINENSAYLGLLNYVLTIIPRDFDPLDLVMNSLQDGYQYAKDWKDFFNKIVEDRANAPAWNELNDDNLKKAHWLVHQLLRKHASPGRIHRFWRNTESFFHNLLVQFRQYASEDANRWRVRRLSITPIETDTWKDREPYDGQLNGQPISLLYRQETKDFITIGNVSRLLAEHQAPSELKDKEFKIHGDDKITRSSRIKNAREEKSSLSVYHPIIPLEVSPSRFRVLLPLNSAEKCVQFAVNRWKVEFARVWDRMPLRVGIVAFPRMMPFQAVIEATRNVEDLLKDTKPETWRVQDGENRDGVVSLHFNRNDHESELCSVPIRMPDGRPDVFYPYCKVTDKTVRTPYDFQHPNGTVYRHMQDLRRGDGVEVQPSKIAVVFMESTARRFEPVNVHYLSDWKQIHEIWLLLNRIAPSQTALKGAWGYLVEQQEKWQTPEGKWTANGESTWLNLLRSVFADRFDKDEAVLATLVDAARTGVLEACLQWHLTILKEKVGENRS